jgi:hypothetical protein
MAARGLFDRAPLCSYGLFFCLAFMPCSRFYRPRQVADLRPLHPDVSLFWFRVRIHGKLALPVGDKNNGNRGKLKDQGKNATARQVEHEFRK